MGAKFRRQHPIGPYFVDFCCLERRVVVEVNGGHHDKQIEADRQRTGFLEERGFRVLRFWDNEVLNEIDAVLQRVAEAVGNPHRDPLPSPDYS